VHVNDLFRIFHLWFLEAFLTGIPAKIANKIKSKNTEWTVGGDAAASPDREVLNSRDSLDWDQGLFHQTCSASCG